jgi:Glycosyl hydrolase family 20, domain 2/Glycosyl hydrolase family 20, catalytic domain
MIDKLAIKRIFPNTFIIAGLLFGISLSAAELTHKENSWFAKKEKNGEAKLSFTKAPDDSKAVAIEFKVDNGTRKQTVILKNSELDSQKKNWPEKFESLEGYFWNDGNVNWLFMRFYCSKQDNFTIVLKINHKGWKKLSINHLDIVKNRSRVKNFNPSALEKLYLFLVPKSSTTSKVSIGKLVWKEKNMNIEKDSNANAAVVEKVSTPPLFDGSITDKNWESAPQLPLRYKRGGGKPSNKSWIKLLYDKDNLYLAGYFGHKPGVKVKDELTAFDAPLWVGEDIEFVLFPTPDMRQYYHLVINPAGTRTDIAMIFDQTADAIRKFHHDWNGKWSAKTKKFNDHWTMQAVIPWQTLGVKQVPNILRFQARRIDRTVAPMEVAAWTKEKYQDSFAILVPEKSSKQNSEALQISNMYLKRLKSGKLKISATISGNDKSEPLKLYSSLSRPSAPPLKSSTTIMPHNNGVFSWEIDTKQPLNGKHVFSLKAEQKNHKTVAEIYPFIQVLPSKVKFADVYINPAPKQMQMGSGSFIPRSEDFISIPYNASARTIKTAKYLAEKIYGVWGVKLTVSRAEKSRIVLKVDAKTVCSKAKNNSPEAYTLNISKNKIEITGSGEAGLYYGVVTMGQIMTSAKQPNVPIQALSIIDWPSFLRRISLVSQQSHNRKSINGKNGHRLDRIKEWIKNRVAGNKFNTIFISWSNQVNYPSLPELHRKDNFSAKEIKELFTFAREHFLEAGPAVSFGSHSKSWTKKFPELKEKLFGAAQLDASNPKVYVLMKKIFGDLIKMAGKPKYFHTGDDEWWHKEHKQTMENFYSGGMNRQELFLKFLNAEHDFLKSKGAKMVMHSDMLIPEHNGGPPWKLTEVANLLPKDIVLTTWSNPLKIFHSKGFKELWRIDNGFSADQRPPREYITGFGRINYWMYDSMFNGMTEDRWTRFCYHSELQAANYAWNRNKREVLPMQEWTMRYLPNLMGTYSFMSNPKAGNKLAPVKLNSDPRLTKKIKLKKHAVIGDIPMEMGAIQINTKKTFKVDFSAPLKISSLYLLSAVNANKKQIKQLHSQFNKNQYSGKPYGFNIGKYILFYRDGSKTEKEILLGRNIALLQHTLVYSRYIKEGRCVYPLTPDQSSTLLQTEWVNPFPEKQVSSFKIISTNPQAPILLCGITTRDTRK